jgi:hypothetical protein
MPPQNPPNLLPAKNLTHLLTTYCHFMYPINRYLSPVTALGGIRQPRIGSTPPSSPEQDRRGLTLHPGVGLHAPTKAFCTFRIAPEALPVERKVCPRETSPLGSVNVRIPVRQAIKAENTIRQMKILQRRMRVSWGWFVIAAIFSALALRGLATDILIVPPGKSTRGRVIVRQEKPASFNWGFGCFSVFSAVGFTFAFYQFRRGSWFNPI